MIKVFDRKREYFPLAFTFDFLYLLLEDFYTNFLEPPDRMLHRQWPNLLAEIFGNLLDIRVAARGLMTEKTLWLYDQWNSLETGVYPTLKDLFYLIKNTKYPPQSHEARYQETLLNRLKGLLAVFGDHICSRRVMDWQKFLDRDWAISLDGIPTDYQNAFIAVTVAKVMSNRMIHNQRSGQLGDLFVFDEAASVFKRAYENTEGTYLLTDYMAKSREFGVGFLLATQSLTNLAPSVMANTATKILVGGAGLGEDYAVFAATTGMTVEQREFLKRRTLPGQACGKDFRYPHPFTFEVPRVV